LASGLIDGTPDTLPVEKKEKIKLIYHDQSKREDRLRFLRESK
jgi:hypothetical protein